MSNDKSRFLPCPGQSTKVYCVCGYNFCICSADGVENELNPRSRVIPRSFDCGFLSKAAVLATVLIALDSVVFPLKINSCDCKKNQDSQFDFGFIANFNMVNKLLKYVTCQHVLIFQH